MTLLDRAPFSLMDGFAPGRGGNFCLFRYAAPILPDQIADATSNP